MKRVNPLFVPFGLYIKALRSAAGKSHYRIEVESGLKISRSNIKQIEEGKLHASDYMLQVLAPHLGKPYEELKAVRIVSELTGEEIEALRKLLCDCK